MSEKECQHIQNMLNAQLNPDKLEKSIIKKSIEMNKSYINICKSSIKELEKNCNPKDRLEAGVAIETIVNHVNVSLLGWKSWCNLKGMDIITEEEFKEIVPKLTKIAISWIKIDEKITKSKTKELEEELKILEKKKTNPESKNINLV